MPDRIAEAALSPDHGAEAEGTPRGAKRLGVSPTTAYVNHNIAQNNRGSEPLMTVDFRINRPEQFARVCSYMSQQAPHTLPLLRAAASGALHLIVPGRDAGLHPGRMAGDRPVCVLLGDDDGTSTGPSGFRCAKAMRKWARGAIVHAAGGEPEHYALAAYGALLCERMVLVETTTQYADAWARLFAGRMPVTLIRPRDGKPHPIPLHPHSLQ